MFALLNLLYAFFKQNVTGKASRLMHLSEVNIIRNTKAGLTILIIEFNSNISFNDNTSI